MELNNKYLKPGPLLLIALAAAVAGCGGKKEPETLVRPVRSELVGDPLAVRDGSQLPGGR